MRITEQKLDLSAEYQSRTLQQREVKQLGGTLQAGQEKSLTLAQESYSQAEWSGSQAPASQSKRAKEPSNEELLRDTLLNRKQLQRQMKLNLDRVKSEETSEKKSSDPASTSASSELSDEEQQELSLPNQLRLMKVMIESLTGIKITLPKTVPTSTADASTTEAGTASPQQTPQSNGNPQDNAAVEVTDLKLEQEQLKFAAHGSVTTADGRNINLDLGFALDYRLISANERITNAGKLKDPLVLNLDGLVAGFTQGTFTFDLDADGNKEEITNLDKGSAFLAMDRNGNGQIDDGKELLGALSGNGFADLATLDQDGNGVLDEGDSQFAQLRLYRPGEALLTLGDKKIGAIFLQNAATPFMHLGAEPDTSKETTQPEQTPAVLRQTGIYLTEEGKVGTVQQLDLRV